MNIFWLAIIVLISTSWINAYDVEPFQFGFCLLNPKFGPCREYHFRYYFDRYTEQCKVFGYGGCFGNRNKFKKKAECENACLGSNVTEICENDDNCTNSGKCVISGRFRICQCLPGTEGVFCSEITVCKEKPDFCGPRNGTFCEFDVIRRQPICKCTDLSHKYNHQERVCKEPCQEGDCENGGKCTLQGNFKYCECLEGTAGNLCSEVIRCNEADFCGTSNNTICKYNRKYKKAVCECLNPREQFDYNERICKEPCQEGDCENGGICKGQGNFKYCECLEGTRGNRCSEIPQCNEPDFCGTDKDAICVYDIKWGHAACDCLKPREEFDYVDMRCNEACQEEECENGGFCAVDLLPCLCIPGTRGFYCSEVEDCNKENFCGVHNDSICTFDQVDSKAVCQCTDSKKQFDYEERICKVPCGAEKCENGGICNGTEDFKFCKCLPGIAGDFCTEIPACEDGSLCGHSSDVRCLYDRTQQKAVCECLNSNTDFNNHTKNCGRNKKTTFLALFGTLFAFLIIAFSVLFYLRWRKRKAGNAVHFNKLKERVGEE